MPPRSYYSSSICSIGSGQFDRWLRLRWQNNEDIRQSRKNLAVLERQLHCTPFVYYYFSPNRMAKIQKLLWRCLLWRFFCCCYLGKAEDEEEKRFYQQLFRLEYGNDQKVLDGMLILNYWVRKWSSFVKFGIQRDGKLCVRPMILLIMSDTTVILTLSAAIGLASTTYREIARAHYLSEKIRHFQKSILIAAIGQVFFSHFFRIYIN